MSNVGTREVEFKIQMKSRRGGLVLLHHHILSAESSGLNREQFEKTASCRTSLRGQDQGVHLG